MVPAILVYRIKAGQTTLGLNPQRQEGNKKETDTEKERGTRARRGDEGRQVSVDMRVCSRGDKYRGLYVREWENQEKKKKKKKECLHERKR